MRERRRQDSANEERTGGEGEKRREGVAREIEGIGVVTRESVTMCRYPVDTALLYLVSSDAKTDISL